MRSPQQGSRPGWAGELNPSTRVAGLLLEALQATSVGVGVEVAAAADRSWFHVVCDTSVLVDQRYAMATPGGN